MLIHVRRVLRWVTMAMAVAGVGLVCAQPFEMIRESRLREAAVAWPNVAGRVLDTNIVPRIARRTRYGVTVTYDYIVAGQHFFGRSIWLTGNSIFLALEDARHFLDSYPVGNRVTVYYDPADPGDATLIRAGNGVQDWAYLEYGLVLIVVAAMWGSVPRRNWARKPAT